MAAQVSANLSSIAVILGVLRYDLDVKDVDSTYLRDIFGGPDATRCHQMPPDATRPTIIPKFGQLMMIRAGQSYHES